MNTQFYLIIKICYPIKLLPINPFILQILGDNCGCPTDHIPIYLLQDIRKKDDTLFFLNYSQAIKEYNNKINSSDDRNYDHEDKKAWTFEIDTFGDSNNLENITSPDFFMPTLIKTPANTDWKNIKFESSGNIFTLDNLIADIKNDLLSFHNQVVNECVPEQNLNFQENTIHSSFGKMKRT